MTQTRRIGELLVDAGAINSAQLTQALSVQAEQGGKVVDVLVSLGYITPGEFLRFLAKQPGVASIDLQNCEISRELLDLIPKEYASKHEVVPIDRIGGLLTIGMVCPLDAKAVGELQELTGLKVKPMLCAPDAVRSAIERYYPTNGQSAAATATAVLGQAEVEVDDNIIGLESSMRLNMVARLLRKIDTLPALPETVSRVRESMQDPETSVADVGNIITLDPPIAAKILGVANSAAYGFPQRVDDLTHSVSLLGLRETYSLVLSCAVLDVFKKSKNFDYRIFWVEAMCAAAAARVVAKACGRRQLFGVFSAGLLHDLGRVAMAEAIPKVYAKVDMYLPPDELIAKEEELLGIAHTEAGYELASHWGLPAEIAEPIRFHHRPELASAHQDNVAIVALASLMARASRGGIEENEDLFTPCQSCLDLLGIDTEIAEAMLDEFLERREDSFRDVLG